MSDLRERVARTAWISHRDRQMAQLGMTPSPYAADLSTPDWAYAIADAVIAELGWREETRTNPMSSAGYTADRITGEQKWHSDIRREHRYVTDWETE